jgi:hypothetical protein
MSSNSILVTGDFIVDRHIYEGRRHRFSEKVESGVRLTPQLGGAALIHSLLVSALEPGQDVPTASRWASHLAVTGSILGPTASHLDAPEQAYAFWRPFPTHAPREKQFWRVSEAMGFGSIPREVDHRWPQAPDLPAEPEIVVVSDGGLGFRSSPPDWHPERFDAARWIVLKTSAPIMSGPLWTRLASKNRDKLIVIVSAADLRTLPVRVSRGLSWEETIQDLVQALAPTGEAHSLTQCRHLIVTFQSEGALWLDFTRASRGPGRREQTTASLVYDGSALEGDHSSTIEGGAFGFSSCMAAAITRELTFDLERPNLAAALEGGLSAMRDLCEAGHGPATEHPHGFPAERLSSVIRKPTYVYSRALFRWEQAAENDWSVIRESQRGKAATYDLARLVLLRGPIALASVPHLRVGALITADRQEIESLRTLHQVVQRYDQQDSGKKPLSIGVFGAPGSGKSFAVRELAGNLVAHSKWIEFNLSQFNDAADLIGAFHQIRDLVLQGNRPIAFFDEFDAQGYRWLKHLLAPMQDGRFQEGQITHPIGKCIFVFAGGTSWTYETLGPEPDHHSTDEDEANRMFRLAKGPDFKSRLDAYLNVVGPNPRVVHVTSRDRGQEADEAFGGRWFRLDRGDVYFPVRRALMIRSELKCKPDDKLDIDAGLVHALLRVDRYTHGARSLGKILQPFIAARPGPLRRSLLLPKSQLAMHVSAEGFMELCSNAPSMPYASHDPLTEQQIDIIAPAIHETFRELGRKRGGLKGEIDKELAALSDFYKESNRAAAGRMLEILNLVGLQLVDGLATATDEAAIRSLLEYSLEALAEAEHDMWMEWHLARDWRYGPKTDTAKRIHQCLRPFTQLPKTETDKDRDSIRHYPDFARRAGLKIVLVEPGVERGKTTGSPRTRARRSLRRSKGRSR